MIDLKALYTDFCEKYNINISSYNQNLYQDISDGLKYFCGRCKNPAVWCNGRHTRMLMTDFVFDLRKVKIIIDKSEKCNLIRGYQVIDANDIQSHNVDGVIISTYRYRNEIKKYIIDNNPNLLYFDLYDWLRRKGHSLENEYYSSNRPEHIYQDIGMLRQKFLKSNTEHQSCKILKEIIFLLVKIKDFRSAVYYAHLLKSIKESNENIELVENLQLIYENEIEIAKNIAKENVLMLCLDGLRRKDMMNSSMRDVAEILHNKSTYFMNAYAISTSTFESIIPCFSDNYDLRTNYFMADKVSKGKCRFISTAKEQGRNIYFYTDGYPYVEDKIEYCQPQVNTLSEKIWDFICEAHNQKNGLFYIHSQACTHFPYVNLYTDEQVYNGTNIMFDYLDENGGKIRGNYDLQHCQALQYINDILAPFLAVLKCSVLLFADHGNIIIQQGTDLQNVKKIDYLCSDDLIGIPLAIMGPNQNSKLECGLISLSSLNDMVISLLQNKNYSIKSSNVIKVQRSEIYNPDFRFIYKRGGNEHSLLAFEAFVFSSGHKLIIYADADVELYQGDELVESPKEIVELLSQVRNQITVCRLEELSCK